MAIKILLMVYFSYIATINASESFQKGLQEFKSKNFSEAQSQFGQALKDNPNNLAILLNLGLTYYELNQKGMALAYLLKANKLDPGFESVNNAISIVKKQLKENSVPQKESDFEYFRKAVLIKISLNSILSLIAVTLLFSGFLWIKYFSTKKKSVEEELDSPDLPVIAVIISLAFIAFSSLGVAKIYEAYTPRAVVLTENTEVKLAPGPEQTQLFILQEGSEVLVGQIQNDWVQITYPGSYTGWVPKEKIFLVK